MTRTVTVEEVEYIAFTVDGIEVFIRKYLVSLKT